MRLLILAISALAALGSVEERHLYNASLQNYLSSFGYLRPTDPSQPNQVQASQVHSALRSLQEFAGLPPTGQLDSATQTLLATKRCGMPDRRHRGRRYAPILWHKNHLTYGIRNYSRHLGPMKVRRAMAAAARLWSEVSALRITEVHQRYADQADMRVSFERGDHGDTYHFDGHGVVLAHAFYPGEDLGGDIHFDDDENWTEKEPGRYEYDKVLLAATAAHEMGHALGLDHVRDKRSIMFPFYLRGTVHQKLPYIDVRTIQHYYGAGDATIPPTPPSTTTTTTQPTTTTTAFHPRRTRTRAPRPDLIPIGMDVCTVKPDAITTMRTEIIVIQGPNMFRLDRRGYEADSGRLVAGFFRGLPRDTPKIEAAYEEPTKDEILVFSGRQYWKLKNLQVVSGYPKNIETLGLPSSVDHIDVIFRWGYNNHVYIFSGSQYWKLRNGREQVEPDYPRDVSMWEGVPSPVDAAYTDNEDNTYFVKDGAFYKFNGRKMAVEHGWPKDVSHVWAKCRPTPARSSQGG